MPISRVWRGYGAAIFLEFGRLLHPKQRRDGSEMGPSGEMGLMIDSGWRIEGPRSILGGSDTEERLWGKALDRLLGAEVASLSLAGRLPEIDIGLSNGLHVVSSMLASGQPEWTLFDRRSDSRFWLCVRGGRVVCEETSFDGDAPVTRRR